MRGNKSRERKAHSLFRDGLHFCTLDGTPVYRRRKVPAHDAVNIITHLRKRIPENNPEPALSYRKQVPKELAIARERSQMISHPSQKCNEVSRDVPAWIQGQTYKFYHRNQFEELNRHRKYIPYDTEEVRSFSSSQLSQRSRRGSQSSEAPNFYFGTGKQQPLGSRIRMKMEERPIAEKIGSLERRDFVLPRVPVKIGHSQLVDTYKP